MIDKYKQVPPLRALKAFEAASRYLSFTKAAEELHVTQAAISHQIKNLEEMTGVSLFKRYNRSLKMTAEGKLYLMSIRDALESLEKATRQLKNRDSSGTLNISVLPSFATKWLSRRIWKFQEKHPEIDVRISAFEWLVDFKKEDCDIAIRYSNQGKWPGLTSELLFKEEVFPVCGRRYYKNMPSDLKPEDLLKMNLMHEDYVNEDWHDCFAMAGIRHLDNLRGTRYSHTVTMLESVENNQGFALGRTPFVQDDINRGLLVAPFDIRLDSSMSYYLVYPSDNHSDRKLQMIRDWLFEEGEKFTRESI